MSERTDKQATFGESRAEQRVDMHCHCLPGIDDGPATLEDALALSRLLIADGTTMVVATPHQLGRYGRANTAQRIRECLTTFNQCLAENQIPLTVLPGAEVRIDENILASVNSGELLTLAGSSTHLLLELPKHTFIDPTPIIEQFAAHGRQVIVAHPERQHGVMERPEIAGRWPKSGAILQVTAGSLLGDFGEQSERAGWTLLSNGWVELIASDAHSVRKRPPRMAAALEAITNRLGLSIARRLCVENPAKVAAGLSIAAHDAPDAINASARTRTPATSLQAWAREMELAGQSRNPGHSSPGFFSRWFWGSTPKPARRPQTME
jgi:protein-tyrosine phosphatase